MLGTCRLLPHLLTYEVKLLVHDIKLIPLLAYLTVTMYCVAEFKCFHQTLGHLNCSSCNFCTAVLNVLGTCSTSPSIYHNHKCTCHACFCTSDCVI